MAALTASILVFQTLVIRPCELFRVFVSPLSLAALLFHVAHFHFPLENERTEIHKLKLI